jgi:plasmid stabilization system protein ParE
MDGADGSPGLDGYREMGARAAEAERVADALRAQVEQLTEERDEPRSRARKAEPSRAPFRDGSRVRVIRRDLLYDRITGGNCLGACAVGEILVVVSNRMGRSRMIKVRHPTLGVGFTHASFLEVVDD